MLGTIWPTTSVVILNGQRDPEAMRTRARRSPCAATGLCEFLGWLTVRLLGRRQTDSIAARLPFYGTLVVLTLAADADRDAERVHSSCA